MAIITLSRGTFAGGEQLAQTLSDRLGYRTVSREQLYTTVHELYGFTEEELGQIMHKAPTRLDHAAEHRRRVFVAIQATLCQLLREDNVIYHGQAGHLFLLGVAHVIRVRLIAPYARRVRMAVEREGLTDYEAGCKIDRVDAEREQWTQFVFGANWANPSLYDMVLNLERMTLDEAAELVSHAVTLSTFQSTAESVRRMEDLTLSNMVLARLLTDPSTQHLELTAEASAGRVVLRGPVDAKSMERAIQLASEVEGVEEAVPSTDP